MSVTLLAVALAICPEQPVRRLPRGVVEMRFNPVLIPALVLPTAVLVILADRVTVVLAGCIAGVTLAQALNRQRESRAQSRRQQIVAAFLGYVVTNLKAGASVEGAFVRAGAQLPGDCPPQLSREIQQLIVATRTGIGPADVLAQTTVAELNDLGALWSLAANRGLPVADLLSRARDRIDHALRHRAATNAALAGPKTTAVVLSALPLAGIGMGTAMGANPIGFLFGGGLGGVLLVVGTGLVCAGFLMSQHIIMGATR